MSWNTSTASTSSNWYFTVKGIFTIKRTIGRCAFQLCPWVTDASVVGDDGDDGDDDLDLSINNNNTSNFRRGGANAIEIDEDDDNPMNRTQMIKQDWCLNQEN